MGILSRLFGVRKHLTENTRQDPRGIVADFGKVLESAPLPPAGVVADVSELPHPKEDIKISILVLIVSIKDVPMQKYLFEAYYSLASWQPNVGPRRVGVDLSTIPTDGNKEDILAGVEPFLKSYEDWMKWEPIVSREQEELLRDLEKLVLK